MATTQFNKEYLAYTKQEAKNWHLYLGGTPEIKYYRGSNPDPNPPTGSCCIPGGPYNSPPQKNATSVYCLDNISEWDCRTYAGGCPALGPYCPPGPEGYCYRWYWTKDGSCSSRNPPCSSIPPQSHEDPSPGFPSGCSGAVVGSIDTPFNWGNDVNALYRIRESDINFSTNRINWAKRITSTPWKANTTDTNHKLIFNSANNIAYLCVSDNLDNRSDSQVRGKNLSNFIPSHTVGLQTYDDGYTWYALFQVDPAKLDFVTGDLIPVPSIDNYKDYSTSTTLEYSYFEKCGSNYKTTDGTCCLYAKNTFIDGVGVTYEKGNLVPFKFVSKCYDCSETAKKLNYDFTFLAGVTIPYPGPYNSSKETSGNQLCSPCGCTMTILSNMDKIEQNIDLINGNSSYRHLYESYQYWSEFKQGLLSVFINFDKVNEGDRTIQYDNPTVIFQSLTGTGALAKLKTIPVEGGHYVNGIELITRGSGYALGDAIPLIESLPTSSLNDAIEVNITPEEFPENPSIMLDNLKTSIKVSLDNEILKNQLSTNITEFTRYGIIKGVKLRTTTKEASNSLNDDEYQILKATTTLNLNPSKSGESPRENPYLSLIGNTKVEFSDSSNKQGKKVYFKYNLDKLGEVTDAKMELISKDYDNFQVGDTLEAGTGFSYVISSINKPDVVYGSGIPILSRDFYVKLPSVDEASYKPKKAITFKITKS